MLPLSMEKGTHIPTQIYMKGPSFILSLIQLLVFINCCVPAIAKGSESLQLRLLTFKISVSHRRPSRSLEDVVEYAH